MRLKPGYTNELAFPKAALTSERLLPSFAGCVRADPDASCGHPAQARLRSTSISREVDRSDHGGGQSQPAGEVWAQRGTVPIPGERDTPPFSGGVDRRLRGP